MLLLSDIQNSRLLEVRGRIQTNSEGRGFFSSTLFKRPQAKGVKGGFNHDLATTVAFQFSANMVG